MFSNSDFSSEAGPADWGHADESMMMNVGFDPSMHYDTSYKNHVNEQPSIMSALPLMDQPDM